MGGAQRNETPHLLTHHGSTNVCSTEDSTQRQVAPAFRKLDNFADRVVHVVVDLLQLPRQELTLCIPTSWQECRNLITSAIPWLLRVPLRWAVLRQVSPSDNTMHTDQVAEQGRRQTVRLTRIGQKGKSSIDC